MRLTPVLRRSAALLGAFALAAGLTPAYADDRPVRNAVDTPRELVAWARAHPAKASITVLRGDERAPVVSLHGNRPMPLASTRKVLILITAAEAIRDGRLDRTAALPLSRVERWYAPGTDGGAHPSAVAAYGTDWTVDTALRAMITYSDNAAADWALDAVGGPRAVDRVTRRLGLTDSDPIWPLLGEYLAWSRHPHAWRTATPQHRQRVAERLAARTRGPVTIVTPPPALQRALALSSVRGSTNQFATLMRSVTKRAAAGDPAASYAVDVLSWPRLDPGTAAAFPTLATKGGSFVGVVTEATAIRSPGQPPVYVAQFYRDLPAAIEEQLGTKFLGQQLYAALARDPHLLDGA